jgi:drug/metabolite transporter (DMT)-like permease
MLPVAGVLSGAMVWGLIWYPYRFLQSNGVSGTLATMITYLIAMLIGMLLLRRIWNEHRAFGGWVLLLVISSGWSNFGYVLAMLHGEVMRVLLLFYLAPVWTILFSFWLLGERLNIHGYLVVALSLTGAFIMLWKPSLGFPLPNSSSEWLGLSAGMSFALSNVISRRTSHLSVEAKCFSVWLGATVLTLPFLLWQGGLVNQIVAIDPQSWLLMVLMGIALWGTSFAVQYGVTHLAANQSAVLFLFELVVAAISSYFFAAEEMGWREWLGAIPIVAAGFLSAKLCLGKSME